MNRITLVVSSILVVSLLVFFGVGAYKELTAVKPDRILPIFGPHTNDTLRHGASVIIQKKYHTIPDFSFIDQTGKTVTANDFRGNIYVTDFFFTTCTGICPKMTTQMERVVNHFAPNKEILFLSHTVNPEGDSVPVLKAFAHERKADPMRWHFVTGNKAEIYRMARNAYFVTDTKGLGDAEDFVHTENFALVDKEGQLRGFYDGTNSADIDRLIADINQLLKFYASQVASDGK